MTDFVSVILSTYNPHPSRLCQTISGLREQTLPLAQWELIIVDNNSLPAVNIDLSWHLNHQLIIATTPGLTYARLEGFKRASGNLIIMVDDDNVLDKSYLKNALDIFRSNQQLGVMGGKSIPLFEVTPPRWLNEFYSNLALRDLGEVPLLTGWENEYPLSAPIGAGMCIRKDALKSYVNKASSGNMIVTDRIGKRLSSGGDNDIVIEVLKSGWQTGYFPSLLLSHIIPEQRMQVSYLAKLLNNSSKSWVLLLESHQLNPWKKIASWTLPLRKIKAWFSYRVWQNKTNYIKWHGACGLFDGLATIKKDAKA